MNLKLILYCTKAKGKNYYLRETPCGRYCLSRDKGESLNGKIVAESDFNCEEIIHTYENKGATYHHFNTKTLDNEQLLRKSHIIGQAIDEYLGNRQYDRNNNVVGYAIHIKNLKVFENPCELNSFYKYDSGELKPLKRAPQNMCYAFDIWGNKYVLISIHPEYLAMVLNGIKTIEVRRTVLKEMK